MRVSCSADTAKTLPTSLGFDLIEAVKPWGSCITCKAEFGSSATVRLDTFDMSRRSSKTALVLARHETCARPAQVAAAEIEPTWRALASVLEVGGMLVPIVFVNPSGDHFPLGGAPKTLLEPWRRDGFVSPSGQRPEHPDLAAARLSFDGSKMTVRMKGGWSFTMPEVPAQVRDVMRGRGGAIVALSYAHDVRDLETSAAVLRDFTSDETRSVQGWARLSRTSSAFGAVRRDA